MKSSTKNKSRGMNLERTEVATWGVHTADLAHRVANEQTLPMEDENGSMGDFGFGSNTLGDQHSGIYNLLNRVALHGYGTHHSRSHAHAKTSRDTRAEGVASNGGLSKYDLIMEAAATVSLFERCTSWTPSPSGGSSNGIAHQPAALPPATVQEHRYPNPTASNGESRDHLGVFRAPIWEPTLSVTPTSFLKKSWMLDNLAQRHQGFNNGYQGNLHSIPGQLQFKNLPDEKNCSLWLTEIPLTVQCHDIFAAINCGPVYALVMNPPAPEKGYFYQAAKLIFCKPESAAYLFTEVRASRFHLHGKRVEARYNRIGNERYAGGATRVLIVNGPSAVVNFPTLDRMFRDFCAFTWDCVQLINVSETNTTMEFRFARIKGQAVMCFHGILKSSIAHHVHVRYGHDPCDQLNLNGWRQI